MRLVASIWSAIKAILLWSYERGTWQYDVLCLLIIGMIFLVPSRYFGDRDRASVVVPVNAQSKTVLPMLTKPGEMIQVVGLDELREFLQRQNQLELLNSPREAMFFYLRAQLQRDVTIIEQEPFMQAGRPGYKIIFK